MDGAICHAYSLWLTVLPQNSVMKGNTLMVFIFVVPHTLPVSLGPLNQPSDEPCPEKRG